MIAKGIIAYDGSRFYGMERQPGRRTVQGAIEQALRRLGILGKISYAGRTDRGVHATRQVVSFQIPPYWQGHLAKLKRELNRHLRGEIFFRQLLSAPPGFHPRHSAQWRSYRYLITSRPTPFSRLYSYYYPYQIPVEKLNWVAQLLVGEWDFKLFAKTGSDPLHYRRTVYFVRFYPYRHWTVFRIVGNSFLRGQVRLLVNFLLKIGEGKLKEEDFYRQLTGERAYFRKPVPPTGLYLTGVGY